MKIILGGYLVTITFLSLSTSEATLSINIWDKGAHFGGYFVFAILLKLAFHKIKGLMAFSICFVYSFLMECIQYFIPERCFEGLDLVANGIGVLGGLLVYGGLKFLGEKRWKKVIKS